MARDQPEQLLGPDQVHDLLQSVKEHAAQLVDTVYPQPLSLAAITRLLRSLLKDGIPISHPLPILSSLSGAVQHTLDHDTLIDIVRADLGGLIVGRVCPPNQPLPVITLAGNSYVSRFGSSAHVNLGLNELIVGTPDEYVATAAALASEVGRLARLRGELRERMTASPLLDYVGFTRNLEAEYRKMWVEWCGKQAGGSRL